MQSLTACGCNKGGASANKNIAYSFRSSDGKVTATVDTADEARQLVRTNGGGSFKPVQRAAK